MAVTVGGGVTIMAMAINYSSPCQNVCRHSAKTVNICYFEAFHTKHHLEIKRNEWVIICVCVWLGTA